MHSTYILHYSVLAVVSTKECPPRRWVCSSVALISNPQRCSLLRRVLPNFHRSHQRQTKTALLSFFIWLFSGPYRLRVRDTAGDHSWRRPPGARRCACSPFPRAARSQITFTHICFCAVLLSRFSAAAGSSPHSRNQDDG